MRVRVGRSIGHDGLAQAEHGGGVVAREQPELARVGVRARDRARVRDRVRVSPNGSGWGQP